MVEEQLGQRRDAVALAAIAAIVACASRLVPLIGGLQTTERAQQALEAVEHHERAGSVERLQERPDRVLAGEARRVGRAAAEVREGLGQETVEARVPLIEAPPDDVRPGGGLHVVGEPVPDEGALAEAAQCLEAQQRMLGILGKQSLSASNFPSKRALREHIAVYMRDWNRNPTAFEWTKPAAAIIRSHQRMLDRISRAVH